MGTWPERGPSTVAISVQWKKDLHLQKQLPKAYAFFLHSLWPHQSALIYVSVHFHSAANFNLSFHVSLYMRLLYDLSPFSSPSVLPVLEIDILQEIPEVDILQEIPVTVFFHVVPSWKVVWNDCSVVILPLRMLEEHCLDVGERVTHPSRQGWSLMQRGGNYRWRIIAIKF